ncbi:MAG: NAD(P)-dependent oxidoreductase [Ginsengibacter sp.]
MKILITGANGFIGSYLASYFLQQGEEVIATSRQFHESTRALLSNASLFELDVLNKKDLNQLSVKADVIIHTATANDIISKDALKGIELSALGTKNILDFAVQNKISKVFLFSTLQVYGTELTGDIDENSPLLSQNDYGINHLFGEMYAELYSRQGKVQAVTVRPGNVYGRILTNAFNRWSLVPGCFCKEANESGTITIKSSGKQMRNFINLQNLSRAVNSIVQHFPDNYECYNLASSQTHTMFEVAEKVKQVYEKLYHQPARLNITGTEPQQSNVFNVSLEKLQKIGFTEDENYTLESEIEQVFYYLKSN